ncbi:MAG: response regulator [Candidatus Riflebacteria bacterium]|nr:response regulator [Candidatus Riflebacteria bacterium]
MKPESDRLHRIGHALVADDEEHTRFTLRLILSRAGFRVTMAADGQEALAKTVDSLSCAQPIDLLVLDVQMPGLTGFELIEGLWRHRIALPVLIVSGYEDRELLAALMKRTVAQFVQKPFEPGEFLDRLTLVIRQHRRLAARRAPAVRRGGLTHPALVSWEDAEGS